MIRWGLALSFGLCIAQAASATPPRELVLEHIDSRDGLSHNSLSAILQDRRGFLWFGTLDGLNRFDGRGFEVWRHDAADPNSLSSNDVTALLEDPDGRLWVGTARGVDRFEPFGWDGPRFEHYTIRRPDGSRVVAQVRVLFLDREGILWAGLARGVMRYHAPEDRFELFAHDPDNPRSLAPGVVHSVQQDRQGSLWALTAPGPENLARQVTLNRFEASDRGFEHFAVPEDWKVSGLLIDRSDTFWLNASGLGVFDPVTARFRRPMLARDYVPMNGIWQDLEGALWISTFRGFLRYHPTDGQLSDLLPRTAAEDRLSGFAGVFAEDRGGTRWLGTRGGVYKIDPHRKPFHHRTRRASDAGSLSGDRVSAVLVDALEILWIGTYGAGLNRLDQLHGPAVHYRHDPADPSSLCHDTIWDLAQAPGGDLWLGVDDGLCRYDRASGRFQRFAIERPAVAGAGDSIRYILVAPSGRLWLATEAGPLSIEPDTATVHRYGSSEPGGPGSGLIHSLYLEEDRRLWLGAHGGELEALDLASGQVTRHPLKTAAGRPLHNEGIFAIRPAAAGTLWLGSGDGLSRYYPTTGQLDHFESRDGLPGSSVYSLLEDPQGRLWLGTNQGLSRFDPQLPADQRFRNFDLSDGIGNLEFNRHAAVRGPDGRFHFGGMNGLTSFDPESIQDNPVIPPVALTRVRVGSRDGESVFDPGDQQRLELTHRQSSLTFEYAALNFTNAARNQYRYRLEGFDDGWIDNGTRRFARYHRVPPGRYVFQVRGSNNDGLWNRQGAKLAIHILPPFWQTTWFRLLIAAAGALLLLALHRLRVGRLLEIERLRNRIAGDLHDDLSSELSGIALAMEVVQQGDVNAGQQRRLAQVRERSLAMLDRLRDIVWCVNPEHDNQDALIRHLRSVAETLLAGHRYRWTAEATPGGIIPLAMRRHLLLIFKESLHNAVRHAEASRIDIRISDQDGVLTLDVVDDGRGFDSATINHGFGLANMRRRAEALGANLRVTSRPGQGTAVSLKVPTPGNRQWIPWRHREDSG